MTLDSLCQLITEQENPSTIEIDCCPTLEKLQMMNDEDQRVAPAVREVLPLIAEAVDDIHERMARGGRLFYVGAGTSGRIGVLDASECPPTFSTAPEEVQPIIAGGEKAVFMATEGAEDDREAGAAEIDSRRIGALDSVVGIAASGRTPFVVAALEAAKAHGALTVGLCNVIPSDFHGLCEHTIAVIVGPEALTGSTRLKAGTAQKMVLNMISTCVMIKLGKTYQNLMVDLKVSNEKLLIRAIRIVERICGCDQETAQRAIEQCDGNVKLSVIAAKIGCDKQEAQHLLQAQHGILRKALESL